MDWDWRAFGGVNWDNKGQEGKSQAMNMRRVTECEGIGRLYLLKAGRAWALLWGWRGGEAPVYLRQDKIPPGHFLASTQSRGGSKRPERCQTDV